LEVSGTKSIIPYKGASNLAAWPTKLVMVLAPPATGHKSWGTAQYPQ